MPYREEGAPCPPSPRPSKRDQRDGLYELVRNHLGSIEDFWIALERTRDFAKAEALSLEFAEDFRLLKDIGWGEHDERETFDLMELLQRLHDEAVKILVGSGGSEAQSRRRRPGQRRARARGARLRAGKAGMRVLSKTAAVTWRGGGKMRSNLDHVVASEQIEFEQNGGREVEVRGWPQLPEAEQEKWVESSPTTRCSTSR
ncbi:MAG TPA: hypothetical protein VGH58_01490 [Solirubrobacterales bacterium]